MEKQEDKPNSGILEDKKKKKYMIKGKSIV
jgi:hypothetical protein